MILRQQSISTIMIVNPRLSQFIGPSQ